MGSGRSWCAGARAPPRAGVPRPDRRTAGSLGTSSVAVGVPRRAATAGSGRRSTVVLHLLRQLRRPAATYRTGPWPARGLVPASRFLFLGAAEAAVARL